jgi:hypothetical protein
MRTRRRRVGGVGIFIGGRATFYRAEARRGTIEVPSWPVLKGLQRPVLKAPVTRGLKRGEGAI